MKTMIKPGRKVGAFFASPQMAMCICHGIVVDVFRENGFDCTITSAADSHTHPPSLHPLGAALDYRTRHLPDGMAASITEEIQIRVGPAFQIRNEPYKRHIHTEYDPPR